MNKPILVFIAALLAGCSSKSIAWLERHNIHVDRKCQAVGHGSREAQIQYLGCGGLYIRQGGQALMIDPYFSHQPFKRVGRSILFGGKLKPMTKQLAYGRKMIIDSLNLRPEELANEVKGIFAAHGHYDHLMDVPFIYEKWLNRSANVFANTSAVATCANVIEKNKLNDIEKIASVRNQVGQYVVFPNGTGSLIRVYPIFANHNPHSHHIKLFSGSVIETPGNYDNVTDRTPANMWLEGQTLSFLIDFVERDTIMYRIFVQSSSCNFPDGFPPDLILKEKKVDLAILGSASYQYSENTYPCTYLAAMKPREVMFIHWEDFFRKYQRSIKTVRKNDIPRFFTEVVPKCASEYFLPVPGFVLNVKY